MLRKKSYINLTIHTKQKWFLKLKKKKINYENNNTNNKGNETKFKQNFYSMSEGNTCIVEPNLKVLPFAIFSTGLD